MTPSGMPKKRCESSHTRSTRDLFLINSLAPWWKRPPIILRNPSGLLKTKASDIWDLTTL
jgi:hypothetical protein